MAIINIILPTTDYIPGEVVHGRISLSCEKKTYCESLRVELKGELIASAKSTHPNSRGDIITRSFVIHHENIMLSQKTTFDSKRQYFDFQFKLPEDLMGSYKGSYGNIRYSITALMMDDSWDIKLTKSELLNVFQTTYDFDDKVTKEIVEHEGEEILEVEIDTQKYCIGDVVAFRYRINTDMKFNTLKAEIEHAENSSLEGAQTIVSISTLWGEEILSENVVRHKWNEWVMRFNKTVPLAFMHDNLRSAIVLKLTISRSYRFDKSAKIVLFPVHCSVIAHSPELPPIEEIPRPKRLKCKKCSYSFKVKDEDVDFGICPTCSKQIYF